MSQRSKSFTPPPPSMIGQTWLDFVAKYPVGQDRQGKGFHYADSGAVFGLEIGVGTAEAQVQGSRPTPYQVVLEFLPVERLTWEALWKSMIPDTLRDFRKGVMSKKVLQAFDLAGINLMPEPYKELKTGCNCPDWMRPCKHALAVLRVLGLEVERDPMILVRLRGGLQDELMDFAPEPETGEPLRTDAIGFWGEDIDWSGFEEKLLAGGTPSLLLKRLGPVAVYGVRMDPDLMFKPVFEGVAAEAKVTLDGIGKKLEK